MDFETFAIAKAFDFMVKYSVLIISSLAGVDANHAWGSLRKGRGGQLGT